MDVAAAVVSVLLALLLVVTAVRKLSHRPAVVTSYRRTGVPEGRLNQLAVILLAGAAGLVGGIFWRPAGIAAAGGLVLYFAVAIGFHVRFRDTAHVATPIVYGVLAVAALVLGLAAV